MKLTKTQHKKLLDTHRGTGYMIFKLNDSTIRLVPINLGKDDKTFYIGNKKLVDYLEEFKIEEAY